MLDAVLALSAAVVALPADQVQMIEAASGSSVAPSISTAVEVPLSNGAGIVSGGLACFPSGRLHISDFVRSEGEFRELVNEAFQADQNSPRGSIIDRTQVSISLKAVNAKLCARGYGVFGMGDRRSLSGNSKFVFDWTYRVSTDVTKTGTTEIHSFEI